jgi:hypothetical protein
MNRGAARVLSVLAIVGQAGIAEAGAPEQARTVVVLRSVNSDAVTTEATARVEGELGAAGFHVAVLPLPPSPLDSDSARQAVETAGAELAPTGAFAILVYPEDRGVTAEIWVSDRLRQKTVVQRARLTEIDHERESEILAVRAVELLKASLAEFWVAPEPAPPAPAPPIAPVEKPAAPAPVSARRTAFAAGIGIGVGVGVLDGFREVGVQWMPTLLASYGWQDGTALQLGLHGLGPNARLAAAHGTASIEEQFATLDVQKTWWPRWPVVPLACAGLGVHHVHVAGTGVPPYVGMTIDDWALLTTAGIGAGIPIYSGLSVVAESRVALAWPPTEVRIGPSDAGRIGGPSLLIDANVFGVFP